MAIIIGLFCAFGLRLSEDEYSRLVSRVITAPEATNFLLEKGPLVVISTYIQDFSGIERFSIIFYTFLIFLFIIKFANKLKLEKRLLFAYLLGSGPIFIAMGGLRINLMVVIVPFFILSVAEKRNLVSSCIIFAFSLCVHYFSVVLAPLGFYQRYLARTKGVNVLFFLTLVIGFALQYDVVIVHAVAGSFRTFSSYVDSNYFTPIGLWSFFDQLIMMSPIFVRYFGKTRFQHGLPDFIDVFCNFSIVCFFLYLFFSQFALLANLLFALATIPIGVVWVWLLSNIYISRSSLIRNWLLTYPVLMILLKIEWLKMVKPLSYSL